MAWTVLIWPRMDTKTQKTIQGSKDPTEFEGAAPGREKHLAKTGALIGALVGAGLFFLLFYIPAQSIEMEHKTALTVVATVFGAILGGALAPLFTMRLSRLRGGTMREAGGLSRR